MSVLMQSGSICLVTLVFVSAVPAHGQVSTSTVPESPEPRSGVPESGVPESAKELSTAPLDHVEYPSDRPLWLNDSPDLESRIHTWVVVTEACESGERCAEKLAKLQHGAVSAYIRALTGSSEVDFYPINDKWINSQLVIETYSGRLTKGGEPMFERAVMLEFTPRTQQEILKSWKNIRVRERLGALGVLVFFGLIALIGSSSVLSLVSRRCRGGAC